MPTDAPAFICMVLFGLQSKKFRHPCSRTSSDSRTPLDSHSPVPLNSRTPQTHVEAAKGVEVSALELDLLLSVLHQLRADVKVVILRKQTELRSSGRLKTKLSRFTFSCVPPPHVSIKPGLTASRRKTPLKQCIVGNSRTTHVASTD